MRKYRLYILMAMVFAGLAVQALLASHAYAAVYISQGTVTSTNLLSGGSASSFNNFYYNISSLPGNSSVTIQFSADNSTWYSAAGTPAASTTLSTTGGANLSLTSLNSLGWSGTSFYYKMYLNSTSDLTGTPVIKNIRLDYTPTSGYENGFVFNNDGSLTFTGATPQISATSTNNLLLQSAATGNIQFFNSSNQITSAGNLTVAGGITGGGVLSVNGTGNSYIQGNVGIGNSSPSQTLSIQGSGATDIFNVASSSGTSDMIIKSNGNVGIGTTTPDSKLDINGFVRFESASSTKVTASIGGGALLAGACASATTSVDSALTVANTVFDTTPQTYPGDGIWWETYLSATGVATTKVCAAIAATPTASLYNFKIIR